MSPLMFRIFSLVAIALAAASMKSHAATLTDTDVRQMQSVVEAQLGAFARDDADLAFATATPKVREEVGSAQRFLAMVRTIYPMVYRHAAAKFQKPEAAAGHATQMVEIRDSEDKSWIVLFMLEQQPDLQWRISACAVAENPWKAS